MPAAVSWAHSLHFAAMPEPAVQPPGRSLLLPPASQQLEAQEHVHTGRLSQPCCAPPPLAPSPQPQQGPQRPPRQGPPQRGRPRSPAPQRGSRCGGGQQWGWLSARPCETVSSAVCSTAPAGTCCWLGNIRHMLPGCCWLLGPYMDGACMVAINANLAMWPAAAEWHLWPQPQMASGLPAGRRVSHMSICVPSR
jgi:hypothetical protein